MRTWRIAFPSRPGQVKISQTRQTERERRRERQREEEIERQAGQLSNCFHSFMLNSRVVPQDLAWDMRHEASSQNRCTASGRRGARCRDLCCCYGSIASGSVDIWLLFADTVVINRVKQDNAQVVEEKGSHRSGKPRPRLTLWARLKHFSSSYTVFFMILRTEWIPPACT